MASGDEFGYPTFRASAQLIMRRGNSLLLLLRQGTGFEDGNYGLVSGHVESDEGTRAAMVREGREEAGLEISEDMLTVIHVMHRNTRWDAEYFDVFMLRYNCDQEPVNMEPEKCAELDWFPINALPPNTIDYIRAAIGDIEAGATFSQHGWDG